MMKVMKMKNILEIEDIKTGEIIKTDIENLANILL